jgi:hypothetical protein
MAKEKEMKNYKPQKEIGPDYFRLIAEKKQKEDELQQIKIELRVYQYQMPNVKKDGH